MSTVSAMLAVVLLLLGDPDPSSVLDGRQVVPTAGRSGNLHPHEPPGFTAISDRSFEERIEGAWKARRDPSFRISSDPSAPVTPPSVGEAFFPVGYKGGRGPIDTYLEFEDRSYRSIYVSAWIKPSESFLGAPSNGINKVFHIWIGGGSVVVVSIQGRNRGPLFPQIRLQGIQSDGRGVSFNVTPQRGTGARMERGQWSQLEIVLKVNSPGQRNGEAHLWINGRKAGEDTNVGFRRMGRDDSWERVSWNPTWGSPRDVVRQPMSLYMDQLYISGTK
jgi:hypothetical protein